LETLYMTKYLNFFISLFILFSLGNLKARATTPITYLTFDREDTSSHIVFNFITEGTGSSTTVYYDTVSHGDKTEKYSFKIASRVESIRGVDRRYHHASAEGLKPDTTYFFIYGDESLGLSQVYKFRTLPSDDSPIRLIIGGDMSSSDKIVETAKASMQSKPHAIIIGGDIAYANGRVKNELRWINWFEQMNQIMTTKDGFLTPLILAIGNHETSIGTANPFNRAPFFFKLFPQNEDKSFFARKLGANIGLVVLDSGHMFRHQDQTKFLRDKLKAFNSLKHKIAVYHAPLYPNHRRYSDKWAARGRKYWQPLFDEYGLSLAFEHHDHTLKRSKIIKQNKVATKGTLYVGDGCWGKDTRSSNQRWYLEKASSTTHVWQAEFLKENIYLKAVGKDGEVYDNISLEQRKKRTIIKELSLN